MRAEPGDWLIVESSNTERPARRGAIEEVHSKDGAPPYLVRWLDSGRSALVFPGPDAYVLAADELKTEQDIAAQRFSSMQHEMVAGHLKRGLVT